MDPIDDDGMAEAISDALNEQEAGVEQIEQEQQRATPDDPFPGADKMPERPDYTRDDSGRFAKKDEQPEQKAEEQQPAEQKKVYRPPWYKDEYGPWEKLSEGFRNAIRDQERNAAQAIEKHSTAAKSWDSVSEAIKPFEQQLAANGQTPQQFVGGLVGIYNNLQQNPVETLDWLAQQTLGAGWTIQELARWQQENNYQARQQDPLTQEVAQLRQQVQQLSQYPQQQQREMLNKQIADWSRDKPDFEAVRPIMAGLANQNPQASLDQLYEEARWAHPEVRARILQEQEDKRRADLAGKRRAGAASPRGEPTANGSSRTRPKMTLEEEIGSLIDNGI